MKEIKEKEKYEDQLACFDGSLMNSLSDNFSFVFILAVPEYRMTKGTRSVLI